LVNRLEDLKPNAAVLGVVPDSLVTVVNTQWFGSECPATTGEGGGRGSTQPLRARTPTSATGLVPTAATIATASMITGKASCTSAIRITRSSTVPKRAGGQPHQHADRGGEEDGARGQRQ
jgi:hypothetical protein